MENNGTRIIDPIYPFTPRNIMRVAAWLASAFFFFYEIYYLSSADPLKEMTLDDFSIFIFPARAIFSLFIIPTFFISRLFYKLGRWEPAGIIYIQAHFFYKLIYAFLVLMITIDYLGKKFVH